MSDEKTSLQIQSPLSQAQRSIDKAENAIAQAFSHPDDQAILQAQNALEKAQRSLEQAQMTENPLAIRQARDQFKEAQMYLSNLQNMSSGEERGHFH